MDAQLVRTQPAVLSETCVSGYVAWHVRLLMGCCLYDSHSHRSYSVVEMFHLWKVQLQFYNGR